MLILPCLIHQMPSSKFCILLQTCPCHVPTTIYRKSFQPMFKTKDTHRLMYRSPTYEIMHISRLLRDYDKEKNIKEKYLCGQHHRRIACYNYNSQEHYYFIQFNRFPGLSRTSSIIPGLSRISRTRTNPDALSTYKARISFWKGKPK